MNRVLVLFIWVFIISSLLNLSNCSYHIDSLNIDDIPGSYNVRIEVDFEETIGDISPLLYGNNTKWLLGGEASFGRDNGIWSKRNNHLNENIRDWLIDSGITILRYGDGGNAEYFYWGWSILPFMERIKTPVRNRWSGDDFYAFGVMEFIELCETIKSEGIIIVNYTMGILDSFYSPEKNNDQRTKREIGIQQAANWVEFMNITAPAHKDSEYPDNYKPEYSLQKMPKGYFAHLRAELGHPEPFRIKYWEIGNETNQFHELGEYIRGAIQYADAMKAVDPSIKIGWVDYGDVKQFKMAANVPWAVDFLAPHDYLIVEDKKKKIPFYGSQSVKRRINVQEGGKYLVRFRAFGRVYFGNKYPEERAVAPRMELKVDGRFVKEIVINKNINKEKKDLVINAYWYEIPIELSQGDHTVSLRMTNDFFDRSFFDINRRGRDVFLHAWLIEGKGEKHDILFPENKHKVIQAPYRYYFLIEEFEKKIAVRKGLVDKYAPWLFIAQTESGYWPKEPALWSALGEALMVMADMRHGIKIRNLWHLYGGFNRAATIHSGTAVEENYHVTPDYYVNKMFSQHFGSEVISSRVRSHESCWDDSAEESLLANSSSFPFQDCVHVIASRNKDQLYIAIVNLHSTKKAIIEMDIKNFVAEASTQYTLRAKNPWDYNATNEKIKDNVFIQVIKENKSHETAYLLPNSFTILEFSKRKSY